MGLFGFLRRSRPPLSPGPGPPVLTEEQKIRYVMTDLRLSREDAEAYVERRTAAQSS